MELRANETSLRLVEPEQNQARILDFPLRRLSEFRFQELPPIVVNSQEYGVVVVPTVIDYSLASPDTNYARNTDASHEISRISDELMGGRLDRQEVFQRYPLLAWIASHKSSWEVMEAIITGAQALRKNAARTGIDGARGEGKFDWLDYHPQGKPMRRTRMGEQLSLRDIQIGDEVAVFDTWEVAVGVGERARHFENFYIEHLTEILQTRLNSESQEAVLGADFAAGSFRYAIQAVEKVFEAHPEWREKFGDGLNKQGETKIPLKLFALDVSEGGLQYIAALAAQYGVSEYIEPVYANLGNPHDPFMSGRHPLLTPETRLDICTTVGLADYFDGGVDDAHNFVRNSVSKADYAGAIRQYLKPGAPYCNANIARLSNMDGHSYTGQEVLRAWFDWYTMYEATPAEFVEAHLKGGWKPTELTRVIVLPSCGVQMDQSFVCLEGRAE